METLGFIGLGNTPEGINCGYWLAEKLIKAGNTVNVYDERANIIEEMAGKGGKGCGSCREVAERSTVIFIMKMLAEEVEEALFGETGAAKGIKPGSVVIDMSSIAPEKEQEFAAKLKELGVQMIDAPANGGGHRSRLERCTLNLLIGGDKDAVDRCMPYLDIVGRFKVHVGPCGSGQACKVATQMLNAIAIQGICEGLIYASKMGCDVMRVRDAMLLRFIDETLLEVHTLRPIDHAFHGFHVWEHQLDLQAALDASRRIGLSLPVTALTQQMFNAVVAQGNRDYDHCSLVVPLEKLADHKIHTDEEYYFNGQALVEYGDKNVENLYWLFDQFKPEKAPEGKPTKLGKK
jgi:2-hydroxy-3-oxopropionate reductase